MSLFETVGDLASPLKPAADLVLPQYQQDQGPGLINSLARGFNDALLETPAGLLLGARYALSGEGTAKERLMLGGLVAAGGVMSAKGAHRRWKTTTRGADFMPARSGYNYLTEELGEKARFVHDTPEAVALATRRPGTAPRQLAMLSASDELSTASGFARWAPEDLEQSASGAALVQQFGRQSGDLADAQVVFARFDHAVSANLFSGPENAEIRTLWREATTNPKALLENPENTQKLLGMMHEFGTLTDGVMGDDMGVGLVGRVEKLTFEDGSLVASVRHPVDWDNGRVVDQTERTSRLNQLNYRSIAPAASERLKTLYEMGTREFEAPSSLQDGPGKNVELGPEWYATARQDIVREFGIPDNSVELDRATAAVSFLSEAEDWSTNIAKAKSFFDRAGDVSDPDFQNWLRDGTRADYGDKATTRTYVGERASEHAARLADIQSKLGDLHATPQTLRKVLRLVGGDETVEAVFRSTGGRKQKNFYTNLRYPELEFPVTIDRHAFDVFLGLDSGVPKRPIDMTVGAGDDVYDVVADTYRVVAEDLGVNPNALQAVTWEMWRALKSRHPKDGWKSNDPFMIPEPDGSPNLVYETLNGRGSFPATIDTTSGPISINTLRRSTVGGLDTSTNPDGSVTFTAPVNEDSATALRHLTPAVLGDDGVPRWTKVRPRRFQNYDEHLRSVRSESSVNETFLMSDLAEVGGHPAMRPGDTIVFTIDDGATIAVPQGLGGTRLQSLGRSQVQGPQYRMDRLGPEDLDPDLFQDPTKSPLKTHSWAAISAALDDSQASKMKIDRFNLDEATADLHRELVKRGYKPIPQRGVYGGVEEPSFLIFGIGPDEALDLGERYGQDSVITNSGLLYNRKMPVDPDTAGGISDVNGFEFTDAPDNMSELVIGGQTVRWNADVSWDDVRPGSQRTSHRRVELPLKTNAKIADLAERLEQRGARDVSIYTTRGEIPGWARAYEEVASDGTQLVTSRYRTGNPASPYGSPVFVRDASGLPDAPVDSPSAATPVDGRVTVSNGVTIDGNFGDRQVEFGENPFDATLDGEKAVGFGYQDGTFTPVFDPAELTSGRFEATVDRKGRISPADPADLSGAIRASQDLSVAGWPGTTEIRASGASFQFAKPADIRPRSEQSVTVNGIEIPRQHNTRPRPDLARRFGFDVDFGWRQGNQILEVEPKLQDRTVSMIEDFMDRHDMAARRWRLPKVSVGRAPDPSIYAALDWGGGRPGGGIVLSQEWFGDSARFTKQFDADRANGLFSPTTTGGPEIIVAHELGHVLHGALRASENFVRSSKFEKELRQLVGRRWQQEAASTISETASTDLSELIAEAYTEVMYGRPSTMSQNVYDFVQDRLETETRFLKAVNSL